MATHTVQLRRGDARDIVAIDRLMGEAFDPRHGEAWTRGQVLGVVAMPGVAMLIAAVEDRPAGFALTRTVIDEAELLLLAVSPTFRRAGVGTALLRAALADAAAAGAAAMHLEVRAGNDAIRLYTAQGFIKVGERRGYYRGRTGQVQDAHSFRRALP